MVASWALVWKYFGEIEDWKWPTVARGDLGGGLEGGFGDLGDWGGEVGMGLG